MAGSRPPPPPWEEPSRVRGGPRLRCSFWARHRVQPIGCFSTYTFSTRDGPSVHCRPLSCASQAQEEGRRRPTARPPTQHRWRLQRDTRIHRLFLRQFVDKAKCTRLSCDLEFTNKIHSHQLRNHMDSAWNNVCLK